LGGHAVHQRLVRVDAHGAFDSQHDRIAVSRSWPNSSSNWDEMHG
jgi:hypothetical protein